MTGTMELDPMSLWFEHNKVTRAITRAIQMYYKAPWRNWTEVDQETKEEWFKLFKRSFTWRPELENEVRKSFEQKGAKRLKGLHHWLTSDKPRKKGKVCPSWMHKDVHDQLLKRLEDPEFIKRSERAKRNKIGGSNESVHPGHVQGSISTREVAERMAAKEGVLPLAATVYRKTHIKEDEVLGKVPCSGKPRKIIDEYEKKMTEYKEKGINKDPNEVYLEVVGGRKKGIIHGLGSSGDLWYKESTTRLKNSSSDYRQSIVSQLSTQMQQSQQQLNERLLQLERQQVEFEKMKADFERERVDLERERLKLQKESNEERRIFYEYLEVMKMKILENSQHEQQCKSTKHPIQPCDRQDSSNEGAPCAT